MMPNFMEADPSESDVSDEWLKGRLLLSLPSAREDTFYRTVILVLAHGPQGALGVVLNRPTEIALGEIFPELQWEAAEPAVLFSGGPVEPDGIICLARGASSEERPGFAPVLDRWGSIDPREPPPGGVDHVRVYRGYAGWAPRQLEFELARGSWLVTGAGPFDVTSEEPEELWENVLARQGPQYRKLKDVPRDPSLN
jgi:putative transcriptional regulator